MSNRRRNLILAALLLAAVSLYLATRIDGQRDVDRQALAGHSLTPAATPTAVGTLMYCPTLTTTVSAASIAYGTPVVLLRAGAVQDLPASATPTTTASPLPSATPRATSTGTVTATPTPANTPTATPTQDPNSAALYCAHSATMLYVSGVITDAWVLSSTTTFSDTLVLTLDALGDGYNQPRGDDHDYYLGPNGRLRDYVSYPVSATVATSRTATGWQFALGIDATTLHGSLAAGQQMGAAFGLRDFDTGGRAWDILLTWAKFALRMQ